MIPNLMKKIFLFFASLTIGSASMVSCTDLSEETYSVIPSDKFFNDEEEFLMSAGVSTPIWFGIPVIAASGERSPYRRTKA